LFSAVASKLGKTTRKQRSMTSRLIWTIVS